MALQQIDCPHCRTQWEMYSRAHADLGSYNRGYFLCICPSCPLPVVIAAEAHIPGNHYQRTSDVAYADRSFKKCGWEVLNIWPKPQFQETAAPVGVTPPIAAMFSQSQRAASNGGYDLAIMGLYRVLKMAQADFSPVRGKPQTWISWLIKNGRLTPDMKQWAEELVGLRTEVENATVRQAQEFGVFVHMLLERLYAVRSRIASFRASAGSIGS